MTYWSPTSASSEYMIIPSCAALVVLLAACVMGSGQIFPNRTRISCANRAVTREQALRIALSWGELAYDVAQPNAPTPELTDMGRYWAVVWPPPPKPHDVVHIYGGVAFDIDKCTGLGANIRMWR